MELLYRRKDRNLYFRRIFQLVNEFDQSCYNSLYGRTRTGASSVRKVGGLLTGALEGLKGEIRLKQGQV